MIYDREDLKTSMNLLKIGKNVISIYMDLFPHYLGKAYIIRSNAFFMMAWKVI